MYHSNQSQTMQTTQGHEGKLPTGPVTAANSAFWKALDSSRESNTGPYAPRNRGENGAAQHSMYGMAGNNTEIQGALTGIFNGMLRDTSRERIVEFVQLVMAEAMRRGGQDEAIGVVDLFCIWANLRDKEGKGERKVSYFMFLEIYKYYPQTVLNMLPEYAELGYWKDYNQILVIIDRDLRSNDNVEVQQSLNILVDAIESLMVEQLQDDQNTYQEWLVEKRNAEQQGIRFTKRLELSLLAKWVGKENRQFDKSIKIAKRLAKRLFPEDFAKDFRIAMKKYRKMYGPLNKAINTTERLMASGNFDQILFNLVPGRCLNKNRRAFLNLKGRQGKEERSVNPKRKKCRSHLLEHLELAKQGKVKMKGRTMFIHELVSQIMDNNNMASEEIDLISAQWQAHQEHYIALMIETGTSLGRGVVLADLSGSMSGVPMQVSIALAIFISSLAHESFRDRFITFETVPRWIVLRYPENDDYTLVHNSEELRRRYPDMPSNDFNRMLETLRSYTTLGSWDSSRAGGELTFSEKVRVAVATPWGGSTDFIAAHEMILKACVDAGLTPEEMPEWMTITSDMKFDEASNTNKVYIDKYGFIHRYIREKSYLSNVTGWKTIHELLGEAYRNAGIEACGQEYKVPKQIHWNLSGNTEGFAVQSDTPNTEMVSGFNVGMLKLFLQNGSLESFEKKPPPTPWDTLRRAIDDERYNKIREICSQSQENALNRYSIPEAEADVNDTTTTDDVQATGEAKDAWVEVHEDDLTPPIKSYNSNMTQEELHEQLKEAQKMLALLQKQMEQSN